MAEQTSTGDKVNLEFGELELRVEQIQSEIEHMKNCKNALFRDLDQIDDLNIKGTYSKVNKKYTKAIEEYYIECVNYYEMQLIILRNIIREYKNIDNSMSSKLKEKNV